jgi:hypothetical protein
MEHHSETTAHLEKGAQRAKGRELLTSSRIGSCSTLAFFLPLRVGAMRATAISGIRSQSRQTDGMRHPICEMRSEKLLIPKLTVAVAEGAQRRDARFKTQTRATVRVLCHPRAWLVHILL